ncbi:MAG: hypothetical protein IPP19_08380 [Verrucomicrobia bacterium]|nr:hypothetical protein [Verrucomicrobiota bacterium]
MIPNHAHFIDAIRDKSLTRIVFYSHPDAGKVDHECAPLDYGPGQDGQNTSDRYWVWDNNDSAGANPIGLLPDQVISVQVIGRNFAPEHLPLGPRTWSVIRDWPVSAKAIPKAETVTTAKTEV